MSSTSASAAGLAGRYATALFDLAVEQDALDAVGNDLDRIATMLEEAPELQRALASPLVNGEAKAGIVKALGEQADFSDLTIRFMGVLGARERLAALGDVVAAFQAMLAERRGETTVEVISAMPLAPAQADAVREMLAASLNKRVKLATTTDPSLLGGLVVRVGSRMVDASLNTKLRHLELAMRGAG